MIRLPRRAWCLAVLAALVAAMFFDMLFFPGTRVLGAEHADMLKQFVPWREFGFGELARGNLALWNPHVFGGAPFFAGMQSALLYPPNWLFLVLPLPLAMNWSVALNVFLLGAFMFAWARRRGLQPLAAVFCGALLMCCAPFFLHLYAGHVTHIAAMAWVPLIFLAADEYRDGRRRGACLLGMLAVAMQILAGHPQYVFYTAIAVGLYALRAAAGLALMYAGGAALAAVQLLPGIDAARETLRDRALPYEAASSFAFPPENLLTLLAPGFFGGFATPYWGRWYEWEASLYFGAIALALAVYGAAKAELRARLALLGAAAATLLLALGSYTPLYALLYEYVPGFGRFRGISKFAFLTAVFLVFLAGAGLDRLMRSPAVERSLIRVLGAAIILALAAALAVRVGPWQQWMAFIGGTQETFLDRTAYRDTAFVARAATGASVAMVVAAAALAAALGVLLAVRAAAPRALALAALAVLELFVFARLSRETSDSARVRIPAVVERLARDPGDYRILNALIPNSGMVTGAFDAWGQDPGVVRRYAEFVYWTEGGNPDHASQYASFNRFHPHLALLRLRYIFFPDGTFAEARAAPMHRLELIGAHRVLEGRNAILAAMAEPGFDPRREVILERAPQPPPAGAANPGTARIVREGTDFLEIEARLESAAVLLVTDAWASGWRASGYEVLPANHALRAIPLGAGTHRIRLEYAPRAFLVGVWVSLAAWLLWISMLANEARVHRGARRGGPGGAG